MKNEYQAPIAFVCFLLVAIFTIGGNIMAEKKYFRHQREWPVILQVAREYDLDPAQTIMLLAMREAENGPKGFEFGVKPAKNTNLETQARWAAGSIKQNTIRYNKLMQEGVYRGARRSVAIGLEKDVKLSEKDEAKFKQWYETIAKTRQLNPNPDDPKHFYAYRKFWQDTEGKTDVGAHFPSEYKKVGHMASPEYAAVSPKTSFVEFMGSYGGPTGMGWAPVQGIPESEQELNKNWVPNVTKIVEKMTKQFKEKGAYNVEY
jgi:hypothetical protein